MRTIKIGPRTAIIAHKSEVAPGSDDFLPLDRFGLYSMVLMGRWTRGELAELIDMDSRGSFDYALPLDWVRYQLATDKHFKQNEWVWLYKKGGPMGGQPFNMVGELFQYRDSILAQLTGEFAPQAAGQEAS